MPRVLRGRVISKGTFQQGPSGSAFSTLIFGSACINCPSSVAHDTVTACLAVGGINDGDTIVVCPNGSLPAGMFLRSACAVSGGISASWHNGASGAQSASADVECSYWTIQS